MGILEELLDAHRCVGDRDSLPIRAHSEIESLRDRVRELEEDRERLRDAAADIIAHTSHYAWCDWVADGVSPCDCGLETKRRLLIA
jgi:hypothetical protein